MIIAALLLADRRKLSMFLIIVWQLYMLNNCMSTCMHTGMI